MLTEQKTYKGRTVIEVVVYGYRPDNARTYCYGFAIGHDPNDFVQGGYRTVEKAVTAAQRFARKYGVEVTEVDV